ncbi:MAG: hypothetical protein HC912_11750 [Saprospiraceae bacterium]|nr:hypothetical protein [Saprospiraceae bacterium]
MAARYRADEKLGSTPSTGLAFFKAGKEVSRLYEVPHLHDLALLIEQLHHL